jgi:hypothetical protein
MASPRRGKTSIDEERIKVATPTKNQSAPMLTMSFSMRMSSEAVEISAQGLSESAAHLPNRSLNENRDHRSQWYHRNRGRQRFGAKTSGNTRFPNRPGEGRSERPRIDRRVVQVG